MKQDGGPVQLEDFVKETLRQIIQGVKDVQKEARENGAWVNPPVTWSEGLRGTRLQNSRNSSLVHEIGFDVAVTVAQGKDKKAEVGIGIGPFVVGGGGKASSARESVSRIKFSVPVSYPMVVLKDGD